LCPLDIYNIQEKGLPVKLIKINHKGSVQFKQNFHYVINNLNLPLQRFDNS
jgi:hypothetical protein